MTLELDYPHFVLVIHAADAKPSLLDQGPILRVQPVIAVVIFDRLARSIKTGCTRICLKYDALEPAQPRSTTAA